MLRRILLVLSAAALMAVMLVAMASAALAVPPSGGGQTGCEAAKTNASHAIQFGGPSWDVLDKNPAKAGEAPGTANNPGWDKERGSDDSNCPN